MTTQDSRSVFSLRFKRPANREALRFMAQEYGETMNEIVESAVEHELALRGAALEIVSSNRLLRGKLQVRIPSVT
jgi:hypothetical protein